MRKYVKPLALLLSLGMVGSSLAACGSSSSSQSSDSSSSADSTAAEASGNATTVDLGGSEIPSSWGDPLYGGSITMYSNGDIDAYFDPAIGDTVGFNLFLEGLWAYDTTSDTKVSGDNVPVSALKGQLAESWEADEDAKTLTVKLRDDVHFFKLDDEYDYYGGRQLVASDVKWTYDRLCGLGSGYDEAMQTESNWAGNLSMLESVEAPDDTTVVFHLTSADEVTVANFMSQFVKIGGPEWDELTEDQQTDYHYACGTGPYYISEFEAGQKVVLSKNEDYYDTDAEGNALPYLDSITFLYIADFTNVVTQFTSGKLDIFGSNRANIVNDSEAQQIATSGTDYYVDSVASSQPEYLAMKCNQEPFNDIRVRKALQLAIPMSEIHSQLLNLAGEPELSGLWNPTTTEWSTADSWSDELVASYTYDPEQAKALLEEAGYPDGFEFTVVTCPDNNTDLWTVAQEYWAQIGVTMNIETVSNFMEAKTIGTASGDARSTASTGAGACGSITAAINQTVDGGWAASLWNEDEEYTEMVNALNSATSLEEQAEQAKAIDEYYAEQHWTINLTGMRNLNTYYSSRICGISAGNCIFSGKITPAILSHIWVSDAEE
jgi:peptide/nickel transport system substrate-binding protein